MIWLLAEGKHTKIYFWNKYPCIVRSDFCAVKLGEKTDAKSIPNTLSHFVASNRIDRSEEANARGQSDNQGVSQMIVKADH
jgi:hypothetical protein